MWGGIRSGWEEPCHIRTLPVVLRFQKPGVPIKNQVVVVVVYFDETRLPTIDPTPRESSFGRDLGPAGEQEDGDRTLTRPWARLGNHWCLSPGCRVSHVISNQVLKLEI